MKKKAIKIAASTAVAASAFVAAAPVQQADAATNVNQLATNAQNAGTVLKWAISVEGSADYKTLPTAQYNAAKAAVKAAEDAAAKLSATEKLSIQAKLVEPKTQVTRAMAYIDAINSSTKIVGLTDTLNSAIKSGDLAQVEKAYHSASFEFKTKQAKLLDRVYGQSTRDGIRNAVKPAMEAALESVKYDVTVKMHLDKTDTLIKENKLEEAAKELGKARYNLDLKDAKFTFKTQLEKSYSDVAAALPLQALQAVGDGKNTVTVKFSKEYLSTEKITSLEAGQFKISGLTVQSAKLSDDKKSVVLTTSNQKADTEYTVVWQGKSVTFKTPAIADTSGIAVNETDAAYVETTQNRTYTAKLTNTDGTPYVGRVTVNLAEVNAATTTTATTAVITSVNGSSYTGNQTWTGVTDSQGNLVFTIAAAYGSTKDTASVTHVRPTITKLDGDQKTNEKLAGTTHFFQLQTANVSKTLNVTSVRVDVANDYVYAVAAGEVNGFKYKWDANDQFFVNGQKVSQDQFESRISNGDTVTVDYNATAANSSTWNITVDVTKSEDLEFGNADVVTYDGYNYDLSGTGQAGNTVKVYRLNNLVGTAVVDSSGKWTLRAVNLEQNASNVFSAYQYLPGKDGVNGAGSENPTTPSVITINEGAFASTGINLVDNGDNGLSVSDVLEFSFKNASYNHEFNKSVTAGTITVTDGQSRTAVLTVKKVKDTPNKLEVTKISDATTGFNFKSSTISIASTTGVINQDQLAFNPSESASTTFKFTAGTGVTTGGTVSNINATPGQEAFAYNGIAYQVTSATTLVNSAGTTIAIGNQIVSGANALVAGDQISVNGNVIKLVKSAAAVAADVNAQILALPATIALTDENAIKAARTAYDALTTDQKALVTNYADLQADEAALATLKTAATNQAVVNGELTKVGNSLQLPADVVAGTSTIKTAVEALIDNNKVTVAVVADGVNWKVTLTSKADTTKTAFKTITVTEVVSPAQAALNAEIAKVGTSLVLPFGSTVDVADIKTYVEGLVNLNVVTVTVTTNGANYDVTLTSKAVAAKTATKTTTSVTVAAS